MYAVGWLGQVSTGGSSENNQIGADGIGVPING